MHRVQRKTGFGSICKAPTDFSVRYLSAILNKQPWAWIVVMMESSICHRTLLVYTRSSEPTNTESKDAALSMKTTRFLWDIQRIWQEATRFQSVLGKAN